MLLVSLYKKSISFFSVSPFSFLKRLFSKTLRFLSSSISMDSSGNFPFLYSSFPTLADDDVSTLDSSPHFHSASPEPLFLVPLRWWSDVNAALYGGGGEYNGVLYNVAWSLSSKKVGKVGIFWEVESEIVLDMTRVGETETGQKLGVSGGGSSSAGDLSLALISEWMFLRAFKW